MRLPMPLKLIWFWTLMLAALGMTMIIIALLTTITARVTVIRTIDDIDRVRSDPSKSDGLAS